MSIKPIPLVLIAITWSLGCLDNLNPYDDGQISKEYLLTINAGEGEEHLTMCQLNDSIIVEISDGPWKIEIIEGLGTNVIQGTPVEDQYYERDISGQILVMTWAFASYLLDQCNDINSTVSEGDHLSLVWCSNLPPFDAWILYKVEVRRDQGLRYLYRTDHDDIIIDQDSKLSVQKEETLVSDIQIDGNDLVEHPFSPSRETVSSPLRDVLWSPMNDTIIYMNKSVAMSLGYDIINVVDPNLFHYDPLMRFDYGGSSISLKESESGTISIDDTGYLITMVHLSKLTSFQKFFSIREGPKTTGIGYSIQRMDGS